MAFTKSSKLLSGLISGISISCLLLTGAPARAQSATIHQLGVLDSADPQMSDGSYFDSYKIAGTAGERVTISLNSSEFDTFLGIMDSEDNLLVSNDDASGTNRNSFISLTLPANGMYTVVTTSFEAGASGGYRLSMRNFNPPPRATTTTASTQTASSGLAPVFNPLALFAIGAALDMFLGGGGGGSSASSDYDPTQDPAMRDASRVRPPAPQPAPPRAPAIDPFFDGPM